MTVVQIVLLTLSAAAAGALAAYFYARNAFGGITLGQSNREPSVEPKLAPSVEQKLEPSIEQRLEPRIESIAERLDTRIELVSQKLEVQIKGFASRINTQAELVSQKLESRLKELASRVNSEADRITGRIDKQFERNELQLNKVTTQVKAGVDAVSKGSVGAVAMIPAFDEEGRLKGFKITGSMAGAVGQQIMHPETLADKAIDRRIFRVRKGPKALAFSALDVPRYYYINSHKSLDIAGDWNRPFGDLVREVINSETTHLSYDRFYTLWQSVRNVAALSAPMIEVGVWRGGSSRFLAEAQKHFGKRGKIYSCDTFSGPVSVAPGQDGHRTLAGFDNVDLGEVKKLLSVYSDIELVIGDILQTASQIAEDTISMIHIDLDLYEPTKFMLETFAPRLDSHGVIVVDDYGFIPCPGVKQSLDEFVEAHPEFHMFHLLTGQALLTKTAGGSSKSLDQPQPRA